LKNYFSKYVEFVSQTYMNAIIVVAEKNYR